MPARSRRQWRRRPARRRHWTDIPRTSLSVPHVDQNRAVHSVVPVGPSITAPEGAGAGLAAGAGADAVVVIGAGVGAGCGTGAAFGATLRAAGRFFGFAAARLGARLATTLFFALVARFFDRAAVFSTR